ncbi:MAG: hypothetical protein GXY84_09410 [Clostridiales bacterium]|nr:hypothetical protein [Clostridiales bacterium]
MGKNRLNKKVGYGMLAAFYAPLLTDRQQALLELYCDEDLSLSEIAGQLSISRQAVSDNLNRAYERLDELESHLQLFQSFIRTREQVQACRDLLRRVKASPDTQQYLEQALATLGEGEVGEGGKDGI